MIDTQSVISDLQSQISISISAHESRLSGEGSSSITSSQLTPCGPSPDRGVLVREECGHCGSQHIVDDVDWTSRTKERKCGMCGRKKIINTVVESKDKSVIESETHRPDDSIDSTTQKEQTMSKIKCIVEGCTKLGATPGQLCYTHYTEKNGTHYTGSTSKDRSCKHPGCDKLAAVKGLCHQHFKALYGINYAEFKRRKNAGETEEVIFAEVKLQREIPPIPETKPPLSETKPPIPDPMTQLPNDPMTQRLNDPTAVLVNFDNHPDLLDALEAIAEADFRTPAQQILYLISQADKILQRAHAVM